MEKIKDEEVRMLEKAVMLSAKLVENQKEAIRLNKELCEMQIFE